MSPLKKTSTFNSDTLYLKYSVKDSGGSKVLPIDVSDAAIGETEIFSMVDRIDLLKIPMELPGDAEQDPGGHWNLPMVPVLWLLPKRADGLNTLSMRSIK
jgi:hypothetical protein